jgi:hypothetical protein
MISLRKRADQNLLYAIDCVSDFFRGEDSSESDVGSYIVTEALMSIIALARATSK